MERPTTKTTRRGKRFLVIDDHPLYCLALTFQLQRLYPDAHVAVYQTIKEAFELMKVEVFDLVLLDLELNDRSGLELIGECRYLDNVPPILVVSAHNRVEYVKRALKSGASGYVTKNSDSKELDEAVIATLSKKRWLSADVAQAIAAESVNLWNMTDQEKPHSGLSRREFEVMLQLCKGNSTKQIAFNLGISVRTVGVHKFKIMHKLGLSNILELLRYCQSHHLLDSETASPPHPSEE